MSINLYKVSPKLYAVTNNEETNQFLSVEGAADYLESIGVPDEAIDTALIEMTQNDHCRANFGMHGGFVFSDGTRLAGVGSNA